MDSSVMIAGGRDARELNSNRKSVIKIILKNDFPILIEKLRKDKGDLQKNYK